MHVPEEVTESNIKQLLAKLPKNITPLERMILCTDGTVQTMLSVLFQAPVKVEVLSQQALLESEIIVRWIRLIAEYAPDNQVTACLAESVIPVKNNKRGFLTAIEEKQMGIGQILKSTGDRQERTILGIYADENVISRNYSLSGDELYIMITEVFPRAALRKAEEMK